MMDLWPIPVFPFESAAITVSTTVWLGVIVCTFFNLRLGWTLSGMVIPGYLVPLLITRPISAGVIVLEAAITYALVHVISERGNRARYWSSFFGRDRFFLILIVSVLVRAVLDGHVLPIIGEWMAEELNFNFDHRGNLHSFGLIVVALIANYFWKPGLLKGTPPLAACIGITYALTALILIPITNFNVGNFHAMYEDITTSLMSSPKSYIILITTAFWASWINLRYAWDFNGILIPALLGLLWQDPYKILISGFECVILYVVGSGVLSVAPFRNMAIQGGRKLVFFFTICYVYRLLLSHLLPWLTPELKLSDAFGFGYLLTTLMAIKIHEKKNYVRMLRGTAEVSLIGAVAGSLIGFSMTNLRIPTMVPEAMVRVSDDTNSHWPNVSLHHQVRADKILLYEKIRRDSYQPPNARELNRFSESMLAIRSWRGVPDDSTLLSVAERLGEIGFEFSILENRFLRLREQSPAHGWGIFVIDLNQNGGAIVEVPAPLDEWGTLEAGLATFDLLDARALAIAGSSRHVNLSRQADVTMTQDTIFHAFHRVFGRQCALEIRQRRGNLDSGSKGSRLFVQGAFPLQIQPSDLRRLAPDIAFRWGKTAAANVLRDDTRGCSIEIQLSETDRRNLYAYGFRSRQAPDPKPNVASNGRVSPTVTQETLANSLKRSCDAILPQGVDSYVPATVAEMLYMDHEVVTPLLRLANKIHIAPNQIDVSAEDVTEVQRNFGIAEKPSWMDSQIEQQLVSIDVAARSLGYTVEVVYEAESNDSYFLLREQTSESPRGWGTYVLRPGMQSSVAVEIPRPLFERRSFEFGVNLFHRPNASVLMIAGAHPKANLDGSADIAKTSNRTNLFNLFRHALLRHLGDRPFLITQARAIQAPVNADIVVATDDAKQTLSEQSHLKQMVLGQLTQDGMNLAYVNGAEETVGYEVGIMMQAATTRISAHKEVMSLWLSPSLRTRFRKQAENYVLASQFETCGIPTRTSSLVSFLREQANETIRSVAVARHPLSKTLMRDLSDYARTHDVVRLYDIRQTYTDHQFVRLLDPLSGQSFLSIRHRDAVMPAILNVTGSVSDRVVPMDEWSPSKVDDFVHGRALWLLPVKHGLLPEIQDPYPPQQKDQQQTDGHRTKQTRREAA